MMPFFVDDLFLRILGLSMPPFDMVWLMETIRDYVEDVRQKKTQQTISRKIKENRLLYELGEITREEYEKRNRELSRKLRMETRVNRTNLSQRVNILG